jgi:glycyl-tRNA synthetase
MYALRKFVKLKEIKIKKIIPKMGILGPQFKDKAGKIKEYLEQLNSIDKEPLSVDIDGKTLIISPDCYEIIETIEKQAGEKFIPHVIEPSYGIDRVLYFILEHNFKEITKKEDDYRLLKLSPKVAPIKVGIFPLVNDKQLITIAKQINENLRDHGIATYFDDGGTIGRRYARMDEIGTPFCVTIDHQCLEDSTVTLRDRDTTKQQRILSKDLANNLMERI